MPFTTIQDVLAATAAGELDLGFCAIENAIEGTVTVTIDTLTQDVDLLIQREVVLDIRMALMAVPGTELADIHTVLSFPHAPGQCRRYLRQTLGHATIESAPSTAEAARLVGEKRPPGVAAIGPSVAADLYDLEVVAIDIEDHPGNQTRFVAVAREGVPARSGHDKTSVVIYQKSDVPGSLLTILQEFAARNINLFEARVAAHQAGPRRLLLRDRPRRPHRRRAGGGRPAGPQEQAGRREVPRLLPGGRRQLPRGQSGGVGVLAGGG